MTEKFPITNRENTGWMPRAVSSFRAGGFLPQRVSFFAVRLLIALIRGYQLFISPAQLFLLGPAGGCRFTPTCSRYALDAVLAHGPIAGSCLAARRICRCHPLGGGGDDPVPGKSAKRAVADAAEN
jgi:uncharacterized protein